MAQPQPLNLQRSEHLRWPPHCIRTQARQACTRLVRKTPGQERADPIGVEVGVLPPAVNQRLVSALISVTRC